MTESILSIAGIAFPTGATRGIEEALRPIGQAANARRTVNGTLVDLSDAVFRKYALSITCTDQDAPALDGIWPGQTVTVDCISELAYVTIGGSPARTVVAGSSRTEGSLTFYRPQLTCLVLDMAFQKNEAGAVVGWSLDLEEV